MALLTVQSASISGAEPTYAGANASDTFYNTGKEVLHVKNGSGGSINVTITSVKPCDQGQTHPVVVAVPAGAERKIGPFPTSRFNDDNNLVTVGYSATASVTAGVFKNT